MGLLQHDVPPWEDKNAGFHGVVGIDIDKVNLIYAEIEPGDTIFFHPFIIHGSGRNRTKNFRKSLTGHFMSTNCTWVQDIKDTSMELPIVDYQVGRWMSFASFLEGVGVELMMQRRLILFLFFFSKVDERTYESPSARRQLAHAEDVADRRSLRSRLQKGRTGFRLGVCSGCRRAAIS